MCFDHDFRITHENVVCVNCGIEKQGEILSEFAHPKVKNSKNDFRNFIIKGLEIFDLPQDLVKLNEDICDILERLFIPTSFSNEILYCYLKLKFEQGTYKKHDLLSYGTYLVIRKRGFQKDIYEISEASGTPISTLMKFENTFSISPELLTSDYDLSYYTKMFNIKYREELEIKNQIENDLKNKVINTSKPTTICAANVFHYLSKHRTISLARFCRLSGIRPGTIYRFMRNKNGSGSNYLKRIKSKS